MAFFYGLTILNVNTNCQEVRVLLPILILVPQVMMVAQDTWSRKACVTFITLHMIYFNVSDASPWKTPP